MFSPNSMVEITRRQVNLVVYNLARSTISSASSQDFDIVRSCIEFEVVNEMI